MAKLKDDPITQADLTEYLDTASDFAFELRCLERLTKLGFDCQHGGSYSDPVTNKTRQFDIHVRKSYKILHISCAIECKNLNSSFPLLVMSVPRPVHESFHELIFSYPPNKEVFDILNNEKIVPNTFDLDSWRSSRLSEAKSPYSSSGFVGKSCVQVGKVVNNGSIIANDAEVYDKWAQALASAVDLVDDAGWKGEQLNNIAYSLILPILVVPDGMLWQVKYESDGTKIDDPKPTDHCSFYIGHEYSPNHIRGDGYTFSHLEFVTFSGLKELLEGILGINTVWFPLCLLNIE